MPDEQTPITVAQDPSPPVATPEEPVEAVLPPATAPAATPAATQVPETKAAPEAKTVEFLVEDENMVFEFPEGTSGDQIRRFMTNRFPGKFPRVERKIDLEDQILDAQKEGERIRTGVKRKKRHGGGVDRPIFPLETIEAAQGLVEKTSGFIKTGLEGIKAELLPAAPPPMVNEATGDFIPSVRFLSPRIGEASQEGISAGAVGMTLRDATPDFQPQGLIERSVFNITGALGRIPEFLAGAVAGGVSTGSPTAAVIGGFAAAEAIDEVVSRSIEEGNIENLSQAIGRGTEATVAGLQGAGTGAALVGFGKIGSLVGKGVGARYFSSQQLGAILGGAGAFGGGTLALGGVSPLLSGQSPTVETFEDAAILLAFFGIGGLAIREGMAAGKTPREIVQGEFDARGIEYPLLPAPRPPHLNVIPSEASIIVPVGSGQVVPPVAPAISRQPREGVAKGLARLHKIEETMKGFRENRDSVLSEDTLNKAKKDMPRHAAMDNLFEVENMIRNLKKALEDPKMAKKLRKLTENRLALTEERRRQLLDIAGVAPVLPADPNRDLKDLNVRQIRAVAKQYNLDARGSKEDLARRVIEARDKARENIRPSNDVFEDAKAFMATFNRDAQETRRIQKITGRDIIDTLHDQVDPAQKAKMLLLKDGSLEAQRALDLLDLQKGANSRATLLFGRANQEIYEGLSDRKVKFVDPSSGELIGEMTLVDAIIRARRFAAIQEHNPANALPSNARQSKAILQNLLEQLGPEEFARLNQRADTYFRIFNEQLQRSKEAGFVGDEHFENMVAVGAYMPKEYIGKIDPTIVSPANQPRSLGLSGRPKRLREGSEEALFTDTKFLLESAIVRGERANMANRASLSLVEFTRKNEGNGFVREATSTKIRKGDRIETIFERPGAGEELIFFFENGESKALVAKDVFAQGWRRDAAGMPINQQLASWLGWVFGAKVLRLFATGPFRPEFSVMNFPRDIAHSFLASDQFGESTFSAFLPKAAGQATIDLMQVAGDSFRRKGAYEDYILEGGGMEFLSQQALSGSEKISPKFRRWMEVANYINQTSEIWVRLADRNRRLKTIAREKGVEVSELTVQDREHATNSARSRMDFADAGGAIRFYDTLAPYQNAAVQAFRGVARTATLQPQRAAFIAGQIVTLSSALYMANRSINPAALDSIPDHRKGDFNFTLPVSVSDFEGGSGELRHLYISIPLDQEASLLKTVTDGAMGLYLGDPVDLGGVTNASSSLLRLEGARFLPLTVKLYLEYMSNEDFLRDYQETFRGPENISPGLEVQAGRTSAVAEHIAPLLGLSPARTDQMVRNGIPRSTFTTLVGGAAAKLFGELPEPERQIAMQELIANIPGIDQIVKSVRDDARFAQTFKDIDRIEADRRQGQTNTLDGLMEAFTQSQSIADRAREGAVIPSPVTTAGRTQALAETRDIIAFVNAQPERDIPRLRRIIEQDVAFLNLPAERRVTWNNIVRSDPTRAAMKYFRLWEAAESPAARLQIQQQLRRAVLASRHDIKWTAEFNAVHRINLAQYEDARTLSDRNDRRSEGLPETLPEQFVEVSP